MDTILFGSYTVRHALFLLAGVAIIYLAIKVLKKALSGDRTPKHMQQVTCAKCGWKGQVSRYNARCPSCNAVLSAIQKK